MQVEIIWYFTKKTINHPCAHAHRVSWAAQTEPWRESMLSKNQKFGVYLISKSLSSDEASDEQVILFKHLLQTCGYEITELTSIEQLETTSNQDLIFYDAAKAEEKMEAFWSF